MTPRSIAILAPSPVPFQSGGAENFWWGLRESLVENSSALVELIKLPAPETSFPEILDSYEMFSKINLNHFDMLVTSKYPAWMCSHPNHVCYMLHPLRGVYDFYPRLGQPLEVPNPGGKLSQLLQLLATPSPSRQDIEPCLALARNALSDRTLPFSLFSLPGPLIRLIVRFLDRIALNSREIRAWLAISHTVAKREEYFPQDAEIRILPPPSSMTKFYCEHGEYFFTASRMSADKRIDLLIEAMAYFPLDIPLKIAGTGSEFEKLRKQAESDRRIQFLGYVSDSDLPNLYAHAIAVPFVPYQEDYGLITIEAMKSGKPVITTKDSGGVCEMVEDGRTGLIVDPVPAKIAAAMRILAEDATLSREMGQSAKQSVANITWSQTALQLLDHVDLCEHKQYPILLTVAPFSADQSGGGGNRRLYHFCNELSAHFNIELVCYGAYGQQEPKTVQYNPRFRETTLPWSDQIATEAERIKSETGECANDVAMLRHCTEDDALLAQLKERGKNAAALVISHPWLYPAASLCFPNLPIIYDAHNVEADIKAHQYGESPVLEETQVVEKTICQKADLISTCSTDDANKLQRLYDIKKLPLLLQHGCEEKTDVLPKRILRNRLPYPAAKLVLFIGSYHGPNVEAVEAIAGFAAQVPQAEFLIAGSVCEAPRLRRLDLPQNVHLIGKVSEKSKQILLQSADLALNPVISGSGVNLKSIEYIFWNLPLISTTFGMRGLPANLDPAVHVCELDEFAQKIQTLLVTPPDEASLSAVCEEFTKKFLWHRVLAPLVPAVKDVLMRSEKNA